MNDVQKELSAEASRIEEGATWSSQGQFEAAKLWTVWNWISGGITAICSGVAGLLTFATDGLVCKLYQEYLLWLLQFLLASTQ